MSGDGRIIDSQGDGIRSVIPGGAEVEGELRVQQNDYLKCNFDNEPISVAKTGAGAATGTGGDENLCLVDLVQWEYHMLGTQTIIAPSMGVDGLDVGLDQTDNDGVEFCLGINAANKGAFVVGTSGAFFAKLQFSIADVSGTDDCAFGFHKVEAYQANIDDYDEMAAMNVISGNITLETILNAGATTSTDTTDDWADAATHELKVLVSAAGVVTYQIDGMPPTTVAAFTFDDAEVVVPFFYFLHASDVAGAIILKSFECGLQ